MDVVLPYVHERKQFGKAIGEFQLMQAKLADMYTMLQSSRAFAYRVAEQFDSGHASRQDAAACLMAPGSPFSIGIGSGISSSTTNWSPRTLISATALRPP